jgi:FkbM family methyltransferase
MKIIKRLLEKIFNYVYPLLKPAGVQKFLRLIGFKFPYHRFAEKLDYQGIVTFEVNGEKIRMKSYNGYIEVTLFWYGPFAIWEAMQLKLWSSLVPSSTVVLDIGANTGIYSLIGALNKEAAVYAFEPVPVVRKMLTENVALNGDRVKIKELVIGDYVGQETLYIPRQGWVDVASINKQFAEHFVITDTMQELICPMTTVDAFLGEIDPSSKEVILAKIDVEGAEHRVLMGMKATLEERNVHFTAELLDEAFFALCVALIPTSYYCYAINERAKTITKTTQFVPGVGNYYFTKEDKGETIAV